MKTIWISSLPALALLGCLSAACSGPSDQASSSSAADSNGGACSAEQQVAAYKKMITQPIIPPRMFAGLDIAGGNDWKGLTLAAAEKTLCGGTEIGESDPTTTAMGWGVNNTTQLELDVDTTTKQVTSFELYAGYEGTLDFASRPTRLTDPTMPNPFGQHTYSIGIGRPILRDGKAWMLDWTNVDSESTELFDALMYTFAPELQSTQTSCRDAQSCLAMTINPNEAVFGARPLGIYFHVTNPAEAPSTPDYIYGFEVKYLPSSNAATTVKLDAEGPVATAVGLGPKNTSCAMKIGMPLQSFLDDCVEVTGNAANDALLRSKALGNAQHVMESNASGDTGVWRLDVAGTHPNFSSQRFNETGPVSTAKATEMAVDIRSGRITNEYAADGTTFTLAATTAIFREYAQSVQDFLHGAMDPNLPQFGLGDAHCILPAGADATAWAPTKGCTGLEQIVIPSLNDGVSNIATVLKPGDVSGLFCADPGVFSHCGFESCDDSGNNCVTDKLGLNGSLFDGTRQQVVAVLGGGDATRVPAAANDDNTYVKLWAKAYVKYLRAASSSPTDISGAAFAGFEPSDSDITITSGVGTNDTVKYLDKLELVVNQTNGFVSSIIFR